MTREELRGWCERVGVELIPWQEEYLLNYLNHGQGPMIVQKQEGRKAMAKVLNAIRGAETRVAILDETRRLDG